MPKNLLTHAHPPSSPSAMALVARAQALLDELEQCNATEGRPDPSRLLLVLAKLFQVGAVAAWQRERFSSPHISMPSSSQKTCTARWRTSYACVEAGARGVQRVSFFSRCAVAGLLLPNGLSPSAHHVVRADAAVQECVERSLRGVGQRGRLDDQGKKAPW